MKTLVTIAFVAAGCGILTGCTLPGRQTASTGGGGSFLPLGGQEQQTAMERVKELSAKSLALADKCMALQKENEVLRNKNRELATASANADRELVQVKKQLKDADVMLEKLSADLQHWKENVLGWRGKIAEAQAEQIKKLIQIISLLNGEFPEADVKAVVNTGSEKKDATDGKNG